MGIGIGIYTKNSKEAVTFYCNVFGLELDYHVLDNERNYFHAELLKDGDPLLAISEANDANLPNGFSLSYSIPVELGYTVHSENEFYRIVSILKEEGKVITDVCSFPWSPLAAVIMDKFGVRWYITLPQHRPDVAEL